MRAPLRPLIFLAVIATAALTLIQVEATSVPDVSVVPVAAREVAAVPPSSTSDDTPRIAVEPSRATPTAETTTEAAPAASSAAIEGLDPFQVYLRLTGILTTTLVTDDKTPVATEQAPITTAQAPVVTVEAPVVTAAQPVPPAAAPVVVAPRPAPPKPAAAATTPVTRPTTSPGAQTTPTTGPVQPSVFEQAQIVSFYGYPGIGTMGELGLHSAAGAAAAVERVAAEYDALNGPREVLPALHLIVAVAQRHPGTSGLYLQRMGDDRLNEYVEAAREAGILLFLDIQIGWSDALTETRLLEDALREPFVHLALDPEFATRHKGTAPGVAIGALGSADVNAVQHYLAGLVREHNLPPKVLILHQFLKSMLTAVEYYDDVAEVDVTIDMDGFGNPYVKLTKYDLYATADYAERAAIKLFYRWDAPLMTPARLLSLDNPPDLVIYQ